ncbi:hypothetical protein K413DRAFT_1186 [Clostridium sp. ASBs410]|nr:hypothetical protein K413DRAFT_1186 [Clostridium sp. ASBs410]
MKEHDEFKKRMESAQKEGIGAVVKCIIDSDVPGGPFTTGLRQTEVIKKTMELMEEYHLTIGEAESFPDALKEALHKNSEQFEKSKPFTIYKRN